MKLRRAGEKVRRKSQKRRREGQKKRSEEKVRRKRREGKKRRENYVRATHVTVLQVTILLGIGLRSELKVRGKV